MRRKCILICFLLVVLILPLLPLPIASPPLTRVLSESEFMSNSFTSSNIPSESHSPYSQYLDVLAAPNMPPPEPNHTTTGIGYNQLFQPQWTQNQTFWNANQDDDVVVYLDKGFIYQETLNFTRIGIPEHWDRIWGEDYDPPSDGWYYPIGVDEMAFMSFNVTGYAPILVEGFWVLLYDGSNGPLDVTIFGAKYNTTSGFNTGPDLSLKLSPTIPFNFPTVSGMEWVWFDFLPYNIILDTSMTFGNTFYIGIRRNPSSSCNWILMDDILWPDSFDEGDAWIGSTIPLTFVEWDFYLDVDHYRLPWPSQINMEVNGTAIPDNWPFPGTGFYDSGIIPSVNVTKAFRRYDVTSNQTPLTFDVEWKAWFFDRIWTPAVFTTYTNESFVDWNISAYIDYPDRARDRLLYITIEKSWTIVDVLRNGLSHPYSRIPGSTYDYVEIVNADDAEWTVLCQSPNLVSGVEVYDEEDNLITDANATDYVIIIADVQDPGSPSSRGFLDVYDPNDVLNHSDWNFGEAYQVKFGWGIYWTVIEAFVPGLYTVHVTWSNGTAAGMNATTLTIHPMTRLYILDEIPLPGEDVIFGSPVEFVVFFSDHAWNPLASATPSVWNESDNSLWQPQHFVHLEDEFENETYAGYYVIWAYTNESLVDILYNITLNMVQAPYVEQNYTKSFHVIDAPTLYVDFVKGQGVIWEPFAHEWQASPQPYINESWRQFTIKVTGRNNTPITDVQLYPVLSWLGNVKHLFWTELYDIGGLRGFYNVTIDVTPIQGISFHVGDTPVISIFAHKPGYKEGVSEVLHIYPQARPSYIDVPNPPPPLYPNWTYMIPLRVVLRDGITSEDVSHGTLVAEIPYLGNITLELATPGLGLYEIPVLNTGGIPPGNHTVTIYATAEDYESSITTGTLTILPKNSIGYRIHNYQTPSGGYGILTLTIQFFFNGGTISQQASKAQAMEYLPEGTKISLECHGIQGNPPDPAPGYVDAEGYATFEIEINHDDQYTFFVTIDEAEDYQGLQTVQLEESPGVYLVIPIVHPITYLFSMLPWVGLGAFMIVGSVFVYRQKIVIPKRRKRLEKYQAIADTFSDVANLNRLLVLHKDSGICVFDPFSEETQDATLVAGFLQAISTFGHDLGDSAGLAEGEKERESLREITYEGYRILIHDGKFVRNALVLGGTPSDQIRGRLEQFTDVFEKRYKKDFENWEGRVDQFNNATDLVEEIFLVSLRLPHTVRERRPRGVTLSSLESDLYILAKELTADREYVFLGQILSTYVAAAKRDKLEVLMAIYQLRMKGILIPWQIGPNLVKAESTAAS